MTKILLVLSILLILISCNSHNKSKTDQLKPPKFTTFHSINPQHFITRLSNKLDENSGLILYNKLFWTFNDSGGENKIYGFNRSGEIKKEIEIEGAKNVDWEDIAQDKKYIYIGDFGNNNGTRKDQTIYRIKKKDIGKKQKQKLDSEKIRFSFENQGIFNFPGKNTPFDCEAMIELDGNLYIFTKDRSDLTTSVYQIPKKKGEYKITPLYKFNVLGLITGADISPDKKILALVGYNNFKPILWLFSDFTTTNFFNGKQTYVEMSAITNAQTEGVCFLGNDTLLISCERTLSFDQQIFFIDLKNIN
jgi:hypothetical protein